MCCLHWPTLFCIQGGLWVSTVVYTPDMTFVLWNWSQILFLLKLKCLNCCNSEHHIISLCALASHLQCYGTHLSPTDSVKSE